MRALHLKLPEPLWAALEEQRRITGEPIAHIVRAALADALQVEHHTLYQVSTSTALVEGIYRGAVTVGQLLEHGDFGLGTFEGLDGEMIVVDGEVFQVRADGAARAAAHGEAQPVRTDHALRGGRRRSRSRLAARSPSCSRRSTRCAARRTSSTPSVSTARSTPCTRAPCAGPMSGVPLIEAAAHQPEFHLRGVAGTMVGFWSPPYTRAPGGRPAITCTSSPPSATPAATCSTAPAAACACSSRKFATCASRCPASEEFLKADLTRDPSADLARAESKPVSR